MQANPLEEWQRLSELYREKNEEELRELANDFTDLTETAQQVLRDEMRKRSMGDPGAPHVAQNHADSPHADPNPLATLLHEPQNHGYDPFFGQEETDQPHEYTWKTPLCECEDREEMWQLSEVLRRAGIESWIEQPGSRYSFGAVNPRLLVAADQLEQARTVATQPIPQEIIEQSKIDQPEFEPPPCPQCGAKDPVLQAVDPANSWLCEVCGKQWTDSAPDQKQAPETAGS